MKISNILSRIPLRLRYLIGFFLMLLLIFVAQKAIFMLYNMGKADGAPFFSCLASLWYGLHLDIVTACYLTAIPLLLVIVSCFVRLPLRRIAIPYYVLICLVFTLLFIVDLVLYSYWGAKPDANDLIYAAKPKEMLAGLPVWFTILGFVVRDAPPLGHSAYPHAPERLALTPQSPALPAPGCTPFPRHARERF